MKLLLGSRIVPIFSDIQNQGELARRSIGFGNSDLRRRQRTRESGTDDVGKSFEVRQ